MCTFLITIGSLQCREVSAASELVVDLLDLGGSRQGKQLEKLAKDPHRVMANSRFLGRVEVPLSETLSHRRGDNLPPLLILLHADEHPGSVFEGTAAPLRSCS